MPMQPSPIRETTAPCDPSLTLSMCASWLGDVPGDAGTAIIGLASGSYRARAAYGSRSRTGRVPLPGPHEQHDPGHHECRGDRGPLGQGLACEGPAEHD